MKIVVTIPAYNEEKTIGILINKINDVMKSNRYNYKILVVDDGSKDKTAMIAKNAKAIVYSHPKNYPFYPTSKLLCSALNIFFSFLKIWEQQSSGPDRGGKTNSRKRKPREKRQGRSLARSEKRKGIATRARWSY